MMDLDNSVYFFLFLIVIDTCVCLYCFNEMRKIRKRWNVERKEIEEYVTDLRNNFEDHK